MGRIARRVPHALFIVSFLLGCGCGGGGNTGPPPPPAPDFALSVSPSSINVSQSSVSPPLTVSVAGLNGFAGAVQVMISGLPTGAVSSPSSPFSVAAGANVCTATLGGKSAAGVFLDTNTLNVTVPALAAGPQQLVVANPGGESMSWDAAVLAN